MPRASNTRRSHYTPVRMHSDSICISDAREDILFRVCRLKDKYYLPVNNMLHVMHLLVDIFVLDFDRRASNLTAGAV